MSRMPHADAPEPRRLAAIDLGSNSFHLLVANYQHDQLQVVAKLGEKVQLAAGLDDDGVLNEAAMQRALACLAQFASFIEGIPSPHLRIVGTNALRDACNSRELIERAEALLGHEIEIIAGREEARLIYLGAAHALADVHGKRLIVDIGGGSTEFIIGERFEPLALESLHMGCVAYTRRFFADGELSEKRFRRAELAALSELANIRRPYRELGWADPVGSSGTIKAVASILAASGDGPEGLIRLEGLHALRDRVIGFKRLDKVAMEGLKEDRAKVFPAGLAILCAVFEAFDLTHMRYSDGALREGVLYDLAGRNTAEDSRLKTLNGLCRRYGIEMRQADNVAGSAAAAFDQVREAWQLGSEQRQFLIWAAKLHELGLAVSHSKFHRHGAYLLENSDLPGFSRPEQQALAFLVLAHRRKFPLAALEAQPRGARLRYGRLARLLRLAVILNHSRPEGPIQDFTLSAEGDTLDLVLSDTLAERALLLNDLRQESRYQQAAGFTLRVDQAMAET
ncbi:exopolyphosphatase / guanosine-5'-triphosphate,3'-diphosphate pyrophosphatase [Modicisalibacter ilicicola DSM 19980]|uniref:Exopolyphosphatase n=1 Tax=Modicisalibacter ilicicola DSM 19980 TaxID=1121942 RepID=A0A1M4V501_9GAMM|nr:exopolyphosphatase [Halomonas ilicicola]SHE63977.1 exopolyphosphatase / guanosine-5'-triphosphate,3'-diphosphate pyrophosphatase [Halomonas ilicicola DSM 19980]